MKFLLASTLLRSIWAIDETFAHSQIEFVDKLLKGNVQSNSGELSPILFAMDASGNTSSFKDAPKGSIARINITGTMVKNSWCNVGMLDIGALIKDADSNKNIIGILLSIDSPGGTIDGLYNLGEIVKSTQKPIVAYTDGMIASAAYWVASQCDYIVASNKTNEIGSVGVMISISDYQPKYEKEGVKFHRVYASQSSDKNQLETSVLEGKYDDYRTLKLDPLAKEFITKVKTGRAVALKDESLTGKMYFADEAVSLGLIDCIGSLEVAIHKIQELSTKNTPKTNENMKKLPLLMALLAITEIQASKTGFEITQEQLEIIETALAAKTPDLSSDSSDKNAESLKNLAKSLADLQTLTKSLSLENKDLQAKVAKLERDPSASGGGASTDTDFSEKTVTSSFKYMHNKN